MELYSPVVGRWRACSNAASNIDVKSSSFWESAEIKEYTMKQRANGLHHFSNYFKPIVSPLLSIPSLFDDFSISINTHTGTYQRILLNQYKGRYLKVWLKLINSREVKIVKHCNTCIMILVIRRATVQTTHLLVNLY